LLQASSAQKTDAKKGERELFAFIFYFAAVTSAPLALPIVISTHCNVEINVLQLIETKLSGIN
jgi:hypothetical protein